MADPVTIALVAGTVFEFAGGMMQANQMEEYGEAQMEAAQAQAHHTRLVAERNAQIATDKGKYDAAVLEIQANQEAASGQRAAIEERRHKRLTQSSALAKAAADGGSAGDPTVLAIAGQIEQAGEWNAMTALYEGEAGASYYRGQADLALYNSQREAEMALFQGEQDATMQLYQGETAMYEAEVAANNQRMSAVTNLIKSGGTLMVKYGPENMADSRAAAGTSGPQMGSYEGGYHGYSASGMGPPSYVSGGSAPIPGRKPTGSYS